MAPSGSWMRPPTGTTATSPPISGRWRPFRARVLITQGRLAEAWSWARDRHVTAEDDLDYLHEFEHITLARLLLAEGVGERSDEPITAAERLLARLLEAAEAGGRTGSALDILVVQSLAHQARSETTAAVSSLVKAVKLAEPEGYVRVFVDEGQPMAALLKLAAKQPEASGYARRLLAAIASPEGRPASGQPLIEPLSERELEVLRLLESELGGPDIAATADGLVTYGANAHQQHLLEARREQSARRGPPRRRTRPALAQRGTTPDRLAQACAGQAQGRPLGSEKSSGHSSRVLMRAHHIRLHGVSSDSGRCCRPELQLATRTRSGMNDQRTPTPDRPESGRYEIQLAGHLDAHWATWFDGLTVSREADGTTVISGLVTDQSALHGLLQRVRDLGLPLVSVNRVEGDQPHTPPSSINERTSR